MTRTALLSFFMIIAQAVVCQAADKCWTSSPPIPIEKNLDRLEQSESGEMRCFDKSTLVVSESNGRTDIMVRIYSKASANSKIELAKKGISCTYDYQDTIFSCPTNNYKNCVKQTLSWVFLNEKYEPQIIMDAKFFASMGMKYPITTPMNESDNKDYVYLALTDLVKYLPPPTKDKEPNMPKVTPKTYSADDEVNTQ